MEDAYWTFSYSPLRNENNIVEGILVICYEITTSIINSKKLEESKEDLRFAIEATELSVWDYDPMKGTFAGNDRLKEWFGLPMKSELELSKAIEVIKETDRERVTKAINTALTIESGDFYDIEYTIVHPHTHHERIIRAKGRAWFNSDHSAYRFNGTLQDITEQALSRQEIIASEERFRIFGNNIQNLAWIADGEGWIYWYNQRWYDYTGTTPKEMEGWGWQKLHHPDHINRILDFVKDAWPLAKPFELTFPLRRYDGEYRWFLTRAFPVLDANGKIERWIGTNTDINEGKLAEDQFRLLAETLPNLVWITDDKGNYEYASKRWIEYSGLDPHNADTWAALVHPDDIQKINDVWTQSLLSGQTYLAEARLKSKTGEYRWHVAQGAPVKNDDGKIIQWIGSMTDIHDQKSFTENLERIVKDRTKESERSNEEL
jgi:PAS domain S-box-containing protein